MAEHLAQQPHGVDVDLAEGLGGFALGGEHTAWAQQAAAVLEEAAVEQALGRSGRIGAIHQHHVVAGVGGFGRPGDAVTDGEVEAGVAPGGAAEAGQVLAGELHHQPVDLHHVEVGDAGVAQALAGGAAVTAADHQHPFDRRGGAEGRMHQGFVVVPLLLLRRHPAAVEQQPLAVGLAVDDRDPLVGAGVLLHHGGGQPVAHPAQLLVHPGARLLLRSHAVGSWLSS